MIKKIKNIYLKNSSNRAAINTIAIYFQRFLAAAISLLTTPIILNSLGVKDYGLYTLTIGFVGMLSFLNWSLSSSTQRYLAFAIGENDIPKLRKIFSTALVIHFVYAILLLFVISLIGYFFVEKILNIAPDSIEDAKNVMYFVGIITFFTIISIPFLGVLRANENFIAISTVGIVETVLKLLIAILLLIITVSNKLTLYSLLLFIVTFIVFTIYVYIVKIKYNQVSISFRFYDINLVKEMLSFLSWSLLGALSTMSRNEGVQVLINMFFGVVKNAAYGISMQINSAIQILSHGIIGSLSPQIIKNAGAGDTNKMIFLMRTMSKFAVFSVSLIAIPLYYTCPFLLKIWLKNIPESTVEYVRLTIIFSLVMLLSAGIQTVFDAIGKVRLYNIWVSIFLLLNLPISYFMFKYGFLSYTIIIVGILLEIISLNVRIHLLRIYINFSSKEYYFDLIFRVFIPTFFMFGILYIVTLLKLNLFLKLILSFLTNLLFYPILIYKFSLEAKQKDIFSGLISKIFKNN